MDIDLQQLPIPDWDLVCPTCQYALRGLPTHRCPECGLRLDIPSLVRSWTRLREPWFTGDERPVPQWDLRCRKCDIVLDGHDGEACNACGEPLTRSLVRPPRQWFLIDRHLCGPLNVPEVVRLLQTELIPHFRSDERTLAEIAVGGDSVDGRYRAASEFYYDVRYLIAEESKHVGEVRRLARETTWHCSQCGEDNPGNFELCWNCGDPQDHSEPVG